MRKHKRIDWTGIERAYRKTDDTIQSIAHRFNVATSTITRRANFESWQRQPVSESARRAVLSAAKAAATREAKKQPVSRAALVARLYRTLERQMVEIEDRIAAHAGASTETEKDARTLATLVRTLDKLSAMERIQPATVAPETDGDVQTDDAYPRDLDAFRQELAERLRELQERDGAAQVDRGGDPERT